MKKLWLTIWAALLIGSLYAQDEKQVAKAYIDLKNAAYNGDIGEVATKGQILLNMLPEESALSDAKKNLQELIKTKSVEKQRQLLGNISEPIWTYLKSNQVETELFLVHCPMKKAFWIDENKSFKNPFYGKQMSGCGKISEQF